MDAAPRSAGFSPLKRPSLGWCRNSLARHLLSRLEQRDLLVLPARTATCSSSSAGFRLPFVRCQL